MNQQLFYKIADHSLMIDTPHADITRELIPSFTPFRVDNDGKSDLLFRFSGNTKIAVPDRKPDDEMKVDGMSFRVFHNLEGITVCGINKYIEHRFNISADRKTVTSDLTLKERYESHFLAFFLRAAYGMAAVNHQTIKIHASVMEKEGKALVFMGKSGTGKSTHSQNWQKFVPNTQLLNDDEPIIRMLKDRSVRVYGSPWSGSTPCYLNASAKVAAFVRLYQSSKNKLTSLRGIDAFTSLYQSVAILRSDKENRDIVMTTVNDILEEVPIYRLDNRPDREAVSLTETLMD